MPHGSTKFQSSWLSDIDSNGQTVRDWCRRGNSEKFAYCRVCASSLAKGYDSGPPSLHHWRI